MIHQKNGIQTYYPCIFWRQGIRWKHNLIRKIIFNASAGGLWLSPLNLCSLRAMPLSTQRPSLLHWAKHWWKTRLSEPLRLQVADGMHFFHESFKWMIWCYCWWKKSCTSWWVVYPIIYRVVYIPGGCLGFLPSTVAFYVAEIRREAPDKWEPVAVSSGSSMPFPNALEIQWSWWICFTAGNLPEIDQTPSGHCWKVLTAAQTATASCRCLRQTMRNDHDHCHTYTSVATKLS